MKSWAELEGALATLKKTTLSKFKIELSNQAIAIVVEDILGDKLHDLIRGRFNTLNLRDLLTLKEILETNPKDAVEAAERELLRSNKKRGDLN